MRVNLVLPAVLAAVIAASAPAAADAKKDGERVRARVVKLLKAVDANNSTGVAAALATKVEIVGLMSLAAECSSFASTTTVTGKDRKRLAGCLAKLDPKFPTASSPFVVDRIGGGWYVTFGDGRQLVFGRKVATPKVQAIRVSSPPDADWSGKVGGAVSPGIDDLVQPMKIEKYEPNGVEGGEENGVEDGVVGGDIGGVVGPPPPPPPPPAPPQNVAPTALEHLRISGEKVIVPDDVTKVEIQRSGKEKIVGSFKLCIDTTGAVIVATMLKSTGFPSYDTKLKTGIKAWRYNTFVVNGKAVPVCTAVTFIYTLKEPEPPADATK